MAHDQIAEGLAIQAKSQLLAFQNGAALPGNPQALLAASLIQQAVLRVDFENQIFYWNGSAKALTDLTTNGDGSYDLAYTSWWTGQTTVLIDHQNTEILAPTTGALTQTAGGALSATNYYVCTTWVTASGETVPSGETAFAVSANNVLNVAAPSSAPAAATGWNVYVSTTAGAETKQNASPIGLGSAWVEPTTGLIAGAALPATNTASPPSGNYFSWVSGLTDRVEWDPTIQAGGDYSPRLYLSPGGQYQQPSNQYPGQSTTNGIKGRRRTIWTIQSSVPPTMQEMNWQQVVSGTSPGTFSTPDKLTFGRRARFNDQRLTNATLNRVLIWNRILTPSEIAALGAYGPKYPVHLLGDSFLNSYEILGILQRSLASRGYIPVTQDGVGGTSLTDQYNRYILNSVLGADISKWKNSTLVVMDGGMDNTVVDNIQALHALLSVMPHNRLLYVEPAPQAGETTGSTARALRDASVALIKQQFPDNFVPTLTAAQNASNGGAADSAEVGKGLWPLSLKTSLTDFHPNAAGHALIATQIYNTLVSKGWV